MQHKHWRVSLVSISARDSKPVEHVQVDDAPQQAITTCTMLGNGSQSSAAIVFSLTSQADLSSTKRMNESVVA